MMALTLVAWFLVGACLGSLVNWATYALAWHARPISPWSPTPAAAPPRRSTDRLPIVGWLGLRRESQLHGRRFWVRPLLVEIVAGAAIAALFWWEVHQLGLVRGQAAVLITPPPLPIFFQFICHVLLLCVMLATSLIDLDEKMVPDEITVSGTVLGLALAVLLPLSLLPHVAERAAPTVVSEPILNGAGGLAVGEHGLPLWLEPATVIAPSAWPPPWCDAGDLRGLAMAVACYWLWCFALAPRIWRGRRGAAAALELILARVWREFSRPPLRRFLVWGTLAIVFVWGLGAQGWIATQASWARLFTALVGLVASGGIVWAVRLIGTAALKREAMGFGDVTLMMMLGTFLGWQACLVLFFLAPFAGLLVGMLQFVLRRDDEIPYVPYLCLAAAVVVVGWAPIWMWAQPLFEWGWLVPAVLGVCLAMLGVMLALWQFIKSALFGRGA